MFDKPFLQNLVATMVNSIHTMFQGRKTGTKKGRPSPTLKS